VISKIRYAFEICTISKWRGCRPIIAIVFLRTALEISLCSAWRV
jgi:hypothetical protein